MMKIMNNVRECGNSAVIWGQSPFIVVRVIVVQEARKKWSKSRHRHLILASEFQVGIKRAQNFTATFKNHHYTHFACSSSLLLTG